MRICVFQNAVEQSIDKIQQDTDRVDVLFISHFDKDHVNSIRYLLSHFKVLKAVTSFIPSVLRTAYSAYTDSAYDEIMRLFDTNNVEVDSVSVLKIEIPKKLKYGISNVLRQMNITSETMYPGLDGLARSMSCLRDAMGDYNAD